jgi:hypothetical protein
LPTSTPIITCASLIADFLTPAGVFSGIFISCCLNISAMIRYASLVLIVSLILGSCLGRKTQEENPAAGDSASTTAAVSADSIDYEGSEEMQDECVFDTSTYKFTTEKLKKYQHNISYRWDSWRAEARTVLADGDTLWLHIGGCDHFSYMATLSTALSIADSAALMEKTRWLARTFLDMGFDTGYDEMIIKRQFELGEHSTAGKEYHYGVITSSDTAVTNHFHDGFHFYDGFSFTRSGTRTRIEIAGYIN